MNPSRLRQHQSVLFYSLCFFFFFEPDDEAYNDLTFREILVISEIVGNEYCMEPPVPLGGLCLDIQKAPGEAALTRRTPDLYKEKVFLRIKHQMNSEEDPSEFSFTGMIDATSNVN